MLCASHAGISPSHGPSGRSAWRRLSSHSGGFEPSRIGHTGTAASVELASAPPSSPSEVVSPAPQAATSIAFERASHGHRRNQRACFILRCIVIETSPARWPPRGEDVLPGVARTATTRAFAVAAVAASRCGAGFVGACSGGANQGLGSDPDAGPGESKADASTTPSNVSSRAEQENDACPSSPENLRGTSAAGAACSTYADCRPSCCGCAASSGSYLAAACVDGRCADKSDACYFGKSDSFCPGENGGSNDGHPPDKRDSGSDGQGDVGPGGGGTTICTDGYGSDCSGTNEKWTGTQCCVSNVTTCVDGYGSDCSGTGEHWTGKQCCL